ncbi:ABC transporter ATP-binding protein [Paracoccus sp. (in: a-proteobacteria)]|uniref:ABC transporter ATP-binding protein n=1 Tax=Paracoccus sp. TaxID=267 RepID=UPI0026E10194|nr:ABC transporter ATP-binding protein [Paracoccus sp. (in: a-proteobacteria)]MDO5646779.1 ABC transporter ATP-binding protein [Paracoccus sp. (in: a-proteobacteria)]
MIHGLPLTLNHIRKSFGGTTVLHDVNITMPAGKFTALLGPSGCGKSTLLRLIAGFDSPDSGQILLDGRDIVTLAPAERNVSMVFQNYALFPHLSVAQNILFGLAVRRTPAAEQDRILGQVAPMVGLDTLLDRKPGQLSGGQQQRVALARAIVSERPVCLMDEPLSNLDAKLRAEMRVEIRALQQRLGLTMVYVTHDQVEAMTMADRIVVMNGGHVDQIATPRELYERPATVFVARFIGTPPMNLIDAADLSGFDPKTQIGIRPEDMRLSADGTPARVTGVEYLGADQLVTAQIGASRVILRMPARLGPPPSDACVTWDTGAQHLFDTATGKRLPDTAPARVYA